MEGDRMIHCWHAERHKNGDRTASVGIWKSTNKVKCFACATPPMGVIDLVMDVLSVDLRAAIRWLAEHFTIKKYIAKGKHLAPRNPEHPYQVGHEQPIELLVGSGIWASLATQTQRIVPVLWKFARKAERDTFTVRLSYGAIMRYSGVCSSRSVKAAIDQLRDIGWLTVKQIECRPPMKPVSDYLLTPYGDEIMELANAMAVRIKAEIAMQKEIRKEQYRARQEALEAATRATSGKFATCTPQAPNALLLSINPLMQDACGKISATCRTHVGKLQDRAQVGKLEKR